MKEAKSVSLKHFLLLVDSVIIDTASILRACIVCVQEIDRQRLHHMWHQLPRQVRIYMSYPLKRFNY